MPHGLVDIDILIGEPTALGRGIGPAALGLLLDRLRLDPAVSLAGVGTSASNEGAIRAFEKAGFRLFREFHDPVYGRCRYMVVEMAMPPDPVMTADGAAGPSLVDRAPERVAD